MRILCITSLPSILLLGLLPFSTAAQEPSFRRDIAPVLVRRCLGCHNERKAEGRYALHTFSALHRAGESGEQPVVASKPANSYLLGKIVEADDDLRMPQEDARLSPEQIALITRWIQAGAPFDGNDPSTPLKNLLPPRQHPAAPRRYHRPVPVFAMEFSPDGQQLMTAGWHELLVWNVATGKLLRRIGGLPQRIHALQFSRDQQWLAIGGGAPGDYGEVRLLKMSDVLSDQAQTPASKLLATRDDVVLDLQFACRGSTLVTVGADNTVSAYDVDAGIPRWQSTPHTDWVTAVDITDYEFAERRVPNEGLDEVLTLTDFESQSGFHLQRHWRFLDGSYIVREANWELSVKLGENPDANEQMTLRKIKVTGIGKTYSVKTDTFTGDALKEHERIIDYLQRLHNDWPEHAPGSPFVVTSSTDRSVKVFRLVDGKLFTTYKGHRREYGPLRGMHRVYGVQVEPGSRRIWSAGEGRHLHGWNPVTVRDEDGTAADMEARFAKEYSIDLLRHELPNPILAFVRGGERLIVGTSGGQVTQFALRGPDAILDINRVANGQAYLGQKDQIYALAVQPTGTKVAAAGYDGTVMIWDRGSGKKMLRFVAAPQ